MPSAAGADDEDEDTEKGFSYGMFKAEGDHHFIRGRTSKAAFNYTKALKLQNEDEYALIARSRCQARQGNLQAALEDVNIVLKGDSNNHRALYQKAETLYNQGNFEMALIFYHRGAKLKPGREEFRLGIQKATQAIDNAVGDKNCTITAEGDTSFFQKEIEEEKTARMALKPTTEGSIKRKKHAEAKDARPKPPKASKDRTIRMLLGRLYGDREFLDQVLQEADRKTATGQSVYNDAWDAIAYLDQRTELWRQERSTEKCVTWNRKYSTATEKVKINNWISRELDKIDWEQAHHMWKESLDHAIKLLIEIDKFEPGVVNKKEAIMAMLNSYIGNALLELNEPRKALDYFKMEKSLADQYDIPEAKSRALDSMGRAYARMGLYKKAINVWNVKLPMAESPLERAWLYHEMGRCHYELGNFHRARELGEKAVVEATAARDNMWLLNALVLVAQALVQLEDFTGALDAFYHALDVAILLDDKLAIDAIRRAIDELNRKIVGLLKKSEKEKDALSEEAALKAIETEDVGVQTDSKTGKETQSIDKLKSPAKGTEDASEDVQEADVPAEDVEISATDSQYPVMSDGQVTWAKRTPSELFRAAMHGGWPQEVWAIAPAVADEAYVTLATNDVYAVGAMVLAFTLRQTGTMRHLVVMVTPEVSHDMHLVLESVFDLVFDVWPINSDDFDNLCLLNRSELGITFTKIHCWRLIQYKKGVFLDADVLVLRNIDELFNREELSAAPDAGWPDCFNSGVFVFVPSLDTFNRLLEFAKRIGSFDGGDQGLLNLFFDKWSTEDIDKHLPFTYNLVAHAFYSYLPAYKQFGAQTKVVHFIGPCKPWNVKFNPKTCKVEEVTLCPNLIQLWWDIFINHILHRLSRSMTGLVGQLSQLQLRCVGSTLPDYMAERRNRFNWERNYIDYMGRDSFENIRRRLDEVILGEEGARCVEAAVDVLVDTGEDLVAVADVADEPALPDMSADENVMTGVDEQRSSQYFIGHFERDISDSQTGVEYSTSWQTRKLYPSPPISPTESKVDTRSMARLSWQTRALPPSPPPCGPAEGHDLGPCDMPAVEDVGLLTGSKLGDSIKRLSSVDGDAAAKEDMDALTASKGDMASKSRLTSETPNERQVTSSQMVSEPDDAAVGDHDILTPSGGLMSAIATGDVTALEDDDALTASKGEVQKAVNSSVADAAAVEDEGVMTASKGQMTTAAGVLSATDAAASEDEVFLAASKGHVTKVSAADLPAIEDEGHLAGSEGKVRASEGTLSNADVAATEDERTLTGSADDVMKTLERPSWKAKPVAQSSSPADDNEPTESSAEMQTMPSWMTKPDEPWAPPSQQRLDENQQRDDEHQSQQHADR